METPQSKCHNGAIQDCQENGVRISRKLNQFGDYEDTTNMSVDDWDYRWDKDQTQFHMPMVHPMLQKHIDSLTNGEKKQRIFLPLCGKSKDIVWLTKLGHKVVGNECAAKGCREFFEENEIPYEVEAIDGIDGDIYRATDEKDIELYRCDFFELNRGILGQFDCIWDRGSFVAIPVTLRKRYKNIITTLMKPSCRYMLDCFQVDNGRFGGPPFDCRDCDVESHFGDTCTIKKLETRDAFTKWQATWGIDTFIEDVYYLKLKNS